MTYIVSEEFKQQVRDFVDGITDSDLETHMVSIRHCIVKDDWHTVVRVLHQMRVLQDDPYVDKYFPGLDELDLSFYDFVSPWDSGDQSSFSRKPVLIHRPRLFAPISEPKKPLYIKDPRLVKSTESDISAISDTLLANLQVIISDLENLESGE